MSMTLEEARQVMSDANHPLHRRYRENDPIITAEIDQAFQQTFGLSEIEVQKIDMGENNG
jgi:hypothetical protein